MKEQILTVITTVCVTTVVLILIWWGVHESDQNHKDKQQRIAVCRQIADSTAKSLCIAVAR